MTEFSLHDYVSDKSNPLSIGLVVEYYTAGEWYARYGVPYNPRLANTYSICRVVWLSNPRLTHEYWYTSTFIRVEENLETYYDPSW